MTSERPIRLIVVDDQAVVREGLALLVDLVPGIEVVGEAADGHEAIELVESLRPDVVLMDLYMPRCDGIEATTAIRQAHPETKVVVLTTYSDDDLVIRALQAGALGYLTKSADRHQIGRAVHAAAAEQAILDPAVQDTLLAAATNRNQPVRPKRPQQSPDDPLTGREKEVLDLMAAGYNNREIAQQLYISAATVKSHINRIFAKTGSRDRVQAIQNAKNLNQK
ncbi:response regulator transcription factor [Nocardia arthritidis]|uniref:Response regulator n=1 Tax=Nocardia arthritidis TaxID=228602 RepID=A0A6G9YMV4_9NOCA|nr:response regulator transcription factor [Nocardia arthritidis]QIS14253.1 response regulator [Nocardia arthritidis]